MSAKPPSHAARMAERDYIIKGLRAIGEAIGNRDTARAHACFEAAHFLENGDARPLGCSGSPGKTKSLTFDGLVAAAACGEWPT